MPAEYNRLVVPQPRSDQLTIRSWIAIAILAVLAIAALLTYVLPSFGIPFEVCRQELADTGVAVSLCGPVGPSDLPVIGVVVLLVLLLTPGIAEFSVAGIGTVRRRLDSIEKQLATITNVVENRQTVTQTLAIDFKALLDQFEARQAQVQDGTPRAAQPSKPLESEQSPSPERALLEARLIRAVEEIVPYARAAESANVRSFAEGTGRSLANAAKMLAAVRDWYVPFQDEIRGAIAARNAIAHAQPMTESALRAAVELAERLRALLRDRIREAGPYTEPEGSGPPMGDD